MSGQSRLPQLIDRPLFVPHITRSIRNNIMANGGQDPLVNLGQAGGQDHADRSQTNGQLPLANEREVSQMLPVNLVHDKPKCNLCVGYHKPLRSAHIFELYYHSMLFNLDRLLLPIFNSSNVLIWLFSVNLASEIFKNAFDSNQTLINICHKEKRTEYGLKLINEKLASTSFLPKK